MKLRESVGWAKLYFQKVKTTLFAFCPCGVWVRKPHKVYYKDKIHFFLEKKRGLRFFLVSPTNAEINFVAQSVRLRAKSRITSGRAKQNT